MVSTMSVQSRKRILIIESVGDTSAKLVFALSEQPASKRPIIAIFDKDTDTVEQCTKERCNRVLEGDYTNISDIERAMRKTCADIVVFVAPPKDHNEDSASAMAATSYPQASLETVLARPAYQHVTFFTLQSTEKSLQPTICKPKSKTRKIKGALSGVSQLWSNLSLFTCSVSSDLLGDSSQRSFSSTKSKKRNRRTIKNADTMESKNSCVSTVVDVSTSESRDETPTSPSTVHVRVEKEKMVQFVVGTVMDDGGLSSLRGANSHSRDIVVTSE